MKRAEAAFAVEKTANVKTGPVSVTYAAQSSCPRSCPLLDNGCYAEGGMVGMHTRSLAAKRVDAVARDEARAIDGLRARGQALRLHVVGDCRTEATTRTVASAADRFSARGGGSVWTYTHAWREVSREAWGDVSVNASVETLADAERAAARGYGAAIVVPEHASAKAETVGNLRVVPCPAQTRDTTCIDCRLCWRAEPGLVISFAAHGNRTRAVRAKLEQIS